MPRKTRQERIEKIAGVARALEERVNREHPGKFRIAVLGTRLVIHRIQEDEARENPTP